MAIIEGQRILGVWGDGVSEDKLYCLDCFPGDIRFLTIGKVLTVEDTHDDEKQYICNKCKKQLVWDGS